MIDAREPNGIYWFDGVWTLVAAVVLVLAIISVLGLVRARLPILTTALWLVVIVALPLLGSLAWLFRSRTGAPGLSRR